MNHEEYESLAASEALGVLPPEEQAQLREHLATCAGCRREADALRAAAAMIAIAAPPVAPPAIVRDQLMSRVRAGSAQDPLPSSSSTSQLSKSRAAVIWPIALAALAAFAVWTQISLRGIREQNRKLATQVIESQRQAAESEQRSLELQRKLETLAAAPTIQLSGQEAAPGASARVFMNPSARTALVFFHNLPPTDPGHSYQLWIIRSDRPAPQSAGVFDVGRDGSATLALENLPLNTEIKAFAVTVEPKGGGTSPTGAKVLVGS